MYQSTSLLVTGISGRVSGEAARHLLAHSPHVPLIGTTRTPQRAELLRSSGMTVRTADFDKADELVAAFAGAARVLFVSAPLDMSPERRMARHRAALAAMEAARVRHVVYTSLQSADDPNLAAMGSDHARTEALLQVSNLSHTVVRNSFYMDLILAMLPTAIQSGNWVTAAQDGRVSYIDWHDCARTAGECLRRPELDGRLVHATGPQALCAQDVVDIANAIFRTRMRVEHSSADDMPRRLVELGLKPQMAAVLTSIDVAIRQGAMAKVSHDVAEIVGTPPMGLESFLLAHQAELRDRL